MGAGRRAARAIGAYLAGGKATWPRPTSRLRAAAPTAPLPHRPQHRPARTDNERVPAVPAPAREARRRYICCAGAECAGNARIAHKVSEGFAFPYGCAHSASGKLELVDRGAIADAARWTPYARPSRSSSAACLLRPRLARRQGPDAARALRPLRRNGEGAHGDAVQALPRKVPTRQGTSSSTGPPSSPASTASPRTRQTCSASPSPSSSARFSSSASASAAAAGSAESELYRELAAEERSTSALLTIEVKAVETLTELHKAQLLTYLRITGLKVGLILNFNTVGLKDGIVRLVL